MAVSIPSKMPQRPQRYDEHREESDTASAPENHPAVNQSAPRMLGFLCTTMFKNHPFSRGFPKALSRGELRELIDVGLAGGEVVSGERRRPACASGDPPDGTGETLRANQDGLFVKLRAAIPVGESPTGAGESPTQPVLGHALRMHCPRND